MPARNRPAIPAGPSEWGTSMTSSSQTNLDRGGGGGEGSRAGSQDHVISARLGLCQGCVI